MRAVVLGAAAGGGFPQWNSNGPGCRRARAGDPAAPARTQASLAVSADGVSWFVLNASPDLRQQIEAAPQLRPRADGGLRSSPIAGVVLTGGEVDTVAGLLTLREGHAFGIHATAATLAVLDANPVFGVLPKDRVPRVTLLLDRPEPLLLPGGAPSGLLAEAFAVPGKPPLYLEADRDPDRVPEPVEDEGTVGLAVSDGSETLFFVPGCAAMTPALAERLRGAAVVFFDGTLWSDDEMVRAGLGRKTGARMGHMSVSGPRGTIAAFRDLQVRRRVLIHINNSNPILLADSPERAEAERAGWEVAYDGMEATA